MADASAAASSPCALRSARGEALVGHFFHCRSDTASDAASATVAAAPATSLPDHASAACALLVHGLMSDRTVSILSAVGHALSAQITCFAFDFPGQGGSEGLFEYGAAPLNTAASASAWG